MKQQGVVQVRQEHRYRVIAMVGVLLAWCVGSAGGQTLWDESFGNWDEDEHWSAGEPYNGLGAIIDTGIVWVTFSGEESSTLTVGDTGNAALGVFSGGDLTTYGGVTLGNTAGSSGYLEVDGIGSTWTHFDWGQEASVGLYGSGWLTVLGGGEVEINGNATVGVEGGSTGVVSVGGADSRLSVNELTVGNHGDGWMTIEDGGYVNSQMRATIGAREGSTTSLVTVTGAGSTWEIRNNLYIGANGHGTLWVQDGGEVRAPIYGNLNAYLGYGGSTATGSVVVDGMGSKWMLEYGDLYVGAEGTGILTVSGGGSVSSSQSYVGDVAGSTGTVIVDGAGSTWLNYDLTVGSYGEGTLTISNGGSVDGGSYVGYGVGSTGEVNVSGVGSVWSNYRLSIGVHGEGSLTITGGGAVISNGGNETYIGEYSDATGTVVVEGIGSTWTVDSSSFYVRYGSLSISNGGSVSTDTYSGSGSTEIGGAPGMTAMVSVDGAGSVWNQTADGTKYIGASGGDGLLEITNGGAVNTAGGITRVGVGAGVSGEVTVDGAGSTWTLGTLNIGYSGGEGLLTISDGGRVQNGMEYGSPISVTLGSSVPPTARGSATVSGSGSVWDIWGDLTVGNTGNGMLTIEDGGQVNNRKGIIAAQTTSTSEVIVSGAGSTWNVDLGLDIGKLGNGSLSVLAGGEVNSGIDGGFGSRIATIGWIDHPLYSSEVTVDGAGSKWTHNGSLLELKVNATLMITNGGEVINREAHISQNSTVSVDGAGSRWINGIGSYDGYLKVGKGSLTVSNGGYVSSDGAVIANLAGSTGVVNVIGNGSIWDTGGLSVGWEGEGELHVADGGQVTSGIEGQSYETYIGANPNSTGEVTVDGAGSKWTNHGDLYVWYGSLEISNGGSVEANSYEVRIDGEASGTGTVSVDGAGSSWTQLDQYGEASSGAYQYIGYADSGSLWITNGATASVSGTAAVGWSTGSTGTVVVDGAGSTWTVSTPPQSPSSLFIGDHGEGGLAISNGASVVSNSLMTIGNYDRGSVEIASGGQLQSRSTSIGVFAGSVGVVSVSGAGSKWTVGSSGGSSMLFIGKQGQGTLTISDGAQMVHNGMAWIGALGEVTVDGATSKWIVTRQLIANGTLTLLNGGTIEAGPQPAGIGEKLEGNGTFTASVIQNYGTISPGMSTGSLVLNGNLIQKTQGKLEYELGELSLGAGTGYDFIDVNGNFTADGTLLLELIDGFEWDDSPVTLLTSDSEIAGMFANVASGARLMTVGGFGSFEVWYGAGSIFNPNDLVLSDFQMSGDTDGDTDVDFDDFLALQNFYGDGGPDSPGDGDGDGDCDFDDFLAVNNFFGAEYGAGLAFVPEPGTGLIAFAVCGLQFAIALGRRGRIIQTTCLRTGTWKLLRSSPRK